MEITPPDLPAIESYPIQTDEAPSLSLTKTGFLNRALAFSIDFIIVQFLYFILFIVGTLAMNLSLKETADPKTDASMMVPFVSVWFFLFICYFTYFHSRGGQTPAKMLLRIKVVTSEGTHPSMCQAFFRSLGYFLSSLFFGFGFLVSIFEKKGRGLHDILVGTQVVLSE